MILKKHRHQDFRNYHQEQSVTRRRIIASFILVFIMVGILIARFFYLQVLHHKLYETKANDNRVMLLAVPPTRGLIYDRNGVVLADNRPIHSLTVVPERTKSVAWLKKQLSGVIDITSDEWDEFKKKFKGYRRSYQSITLKSQLTDKQWARVSVDLYKLDGVQVETQLTRYYPYKKAFAHMVGYVGRITEKDLEHVNKDEYQGALFIGKTGVEGYYEHTLFGKSGINKVEVNARGRIMKKISNTPPVTGKSVHLYIDARLQQYAYDLLGKYKGAVVAIDPNTGGILVLVSKPGFNPNLFVRGISSKDYLALRNSKKLPLFNRALRGGYPPASTIKPYMALTGLQYGYANWTKKYFARGYYQINPGGRKYRDWKHSGHGWINLQQAIIESVDTYFYQLADKMGITPIHDFLTRFGFGKSDLLDLYGASDGLLPSKTWKKVKYHQPWYSGDSVNVGIGQGFMVATPMQMATAVSIIAARGHYFDPRMAKMISDEPATFDGKGGVHNLILKDQSNREKIVTAMQKVITNPKGTGRRLQGTDYTMAGKTGTGQVFSLQDGQTYEANKLDKRLHDHALFIGFAPVAHPKIAAFAIFENGGSPKKPEDLMKKLFDAYIDGKYPKRYDYLKGNEK